MRKIPGVWGLAPIKENRLQTTSLLSYTLTSFSQLTLDQYTPHTSNWDAVNMLAMATMYRIRIHWVGKHTLFQWPLGVLMRWLGGVPVDRRSRQNAVQQLAAEFACREELRLAITPEGTRGQAEFWKSGFYFIACEAQVPIVLGLLDYNKKVGGLFEVIHPTGDIHADMEKIREFYNGAKGKFADDFGPIRLREEVTSKSNSGDEPAGQN